MLEVKGLSKIYRPKKGVPVKALDNVTISFPDTGMVFLLGKSGSGKSTLLNLIGGLDRYDEGDILIGGNSTKQFRQGDFDSYRNTFVGFIFQEYNVLEEFTVGANIALALELQGKKATDEAIGAILEKVDLAGYGNRRPGELSGGQKQRVAIARALVKNPRIIMADEPTGALDSATGRAVLDTLKKLSAEKLVIVVSHDRDFATAYGDRIIELADGKVISDREYFSTVGESVRNAPRFEDQTVILPRGYHLTEADREQINRYMDALADGDLVLLPENAGSGGRESRETAARAPRIKEKLDLIRSRLPVKAAFRIGRGALKHKKFRLAVTIFLSCIAFGLFGLADTLGSYDHVHTLTQSIIDTGIRYASVMREEKIITGRDSYYWRRNSPSVGEEDIDEIRENGGVSLQGVFVPGNETLAFSEQYDASKEFSQTEYHIYAYGLSGFAKTDLERLQKSGCSLKAGRLPAGEGEIALSSYVCETFYIGGYRAPDAAESAPFLPVKGPGDMLGKVLRLAGRDFTVVGVVDTGMDLERYRGLTKAREEEPSTADLLVDYALYNELGGLRNFSLAQIGFISGETLAEWLKSSPSLHVPDRGYTDLVCRDGNGEEYYLFSETVGRIADRGACEIRWLNGERKTLGEKEIVLSAGCLSEFLMARGETDFAGISPADPDFDWEKAANILNQTDFRMELTLYDDADEPRTEENWRVAGILLPGEGVSLDAVGHSFLLPDGLFKALLSKTDGVYQFAVGQMPADREGIERLVSFCESEAGDHRFVLQNPVTYELDAVHEVFVTLSKVFFWIGVFFAAFAAMMLANFIATSIQYKKQEIGILRAIGARAGDVFRIFFSESFVIAMTNFILSALGTFTATAVINAVIRSRARVLITVLTFGPRQVFLILMVSLFVAFLASFLPVRRIARKKPIDAIRNR